MFPEDPKKKKNAEVETDNGFGQSHGYDEQHGGPSGPGDAPAKPVPSKAPKGAKVAPKRTSMSDAFRLACRESHRGGRTLVHASFVGGAHAP